MINAEFNIIWLTAIAVALIVGLALVSKSLVYRDGDVSFCHRSISGCVVIKDTALPDGFNANTTITVSNREYG